jgi:hypothetical protein
MTSVEHLACKTRACFETLIWVFVLYVLPNHFLHSNVWAVNTAMLVIVYTDTTECRPWLHLWLDLGKSVSNFETMAALDDMITGS